MQERFTDHFKSGWWFANGESVSGAGSTLDATTEIRAELPGFLTKYEVDVFLDAPCGDWNWMKEVELPQGVHYIGADIVPELIEEVRAKFASDRIEFRHVDITSDPLPSAKMMMCRDALFHLSNADIWRFVDNFLASDIEYLLTTNMPQVEANRDIVTGKHRPLNLGAAPFNFGPPTDSFADFHAPRREKYMALWTRAQLAEYRKKSGH
ncbi:MAG: class I SAM-dependent methyltransferase [Erythrobacter sp.]|nr:MAG: class I SAM-dependent methyltransferase [Erythrobacter sp.]